MLESLVACAGVTLGQIAKAMEADSDIMLPVQYWEVIADKLHAAGWSWGYCRAVTHHGWRWIGDADCEGGRRHIVQSDELLTAFLQLEGMFSAETIPGSSHANIWAAGIESASSGAQQDAVSAASRTHNIWQLQTFNEPQPNPT